MPGTPPSPSMVGAGRTHRGAGLGSDVSPDGLGPLVDLLVTWGASWGALVPQ